MNSYTLDTIYHNLPLQKLQFNPTKAYQNYPHAYTAETDDLLNEETLRECGFFDLNCKFDKLMNYGKGMMANNDKELIQVQNKELCDRDCAPDDLLCKAQMLNCRGVKKLEGTFGTNYIWIIIAASIAAGYLVHSLTIGSGLIKPTRTRKASKKGVKNKDV